LNKFFSHNGISSVVDTMYVLSGKCQFLFLKPAGYGVVDYVPEIVRLLGGTH
jgi:hypothetical protein